MCCKCDFKSLNLNDLNAHTQSTHMSMKVNIDADDQTIIVCNKCDYKCRLNIQLKKHTTKKHPSESKYNCTECSLETNYVSNTWEHTHDEHPDKAFEFTPKEAENCILKLAAEQNANIV